MQVDDQVAIQGNGNQDTQSWYHSAEVNVLIDSAQIVRDWMEALNRQQNTALYGRVDDDGIWRDKATGKTPAEMDAWEAEQRAAGIEKPEGAAAINGEPIKDEGLQGGQTPKSTISRLSLGKKKKSMPKDPAPTSKTSAVPKPQEKEVRANVVDALQQDSQAVRA